MYQIAVDKVDIYKAMRKSYDARSDVAHGRGANPTEIATHADYAHSALRQALLKLLQSPDCLDPKSIEEDFLKGTRS
jgi:hypothetical protein